ncbi:MAG: hypothetical protein LBV60_25795 [Streptomyces sp.]|jgi:hypothetical protein|nr:hypothetical protein [Streptomyces sp.]
MDNTSTPAPEPVRRDGRRTRRIIGTVLLAVAIGAGGYWYASQPSDAEKALKYARKACEHVQMDGTQSDGTSADELSAGEESDAWQRNANDAARAARLDSRWDELAKAADAQYRAWTVQARGPEIGELQPLLDVTQQHPFEPECRKALVD